MAIPNLNPPILTAKKREISPELATQAQYMLAMYLKSSSFWFTFCPDNRAAHIGLNPGLRCGLCDNYHPWIELTRDEVKLLANKQMFDKMARFIDQNMDRPIVEETLG